MSTKTDEKPKGRRSSLKTHDANQLESAALKVKNKRNSVSWGQSNTFQFKAMKAMFQESNDVNRPSKDEAKHKQFLESRKKSIKNEFSIVKEMMKNNKNMMEEEDDEDDEVKENTDKNVKIGKEALNDESSDSSSSSHNESEEDDDDDSGNEEEKNNEKEKEKEGEKEDEKEK